MTSPDVTPRSFALLSATVLGWTDLAFLCAQILFGASMSGQWIAVGSPVQPCGIRNDPDAQGARHGVVGASARDQPTAPRPSKTASLVKTKPVRTPIAPKSATRAAGAHRIALGLKPGISAANRRRTRLLSTCRPCGLFVLEGPVRRRRLERRKLRPAISPQMEISGGGARVSS